MKAGEEGGAERLEVEQVVRDRGTQAGHVGQKERRGSENGLLLPGHKVDPLGPGHGGAELASTTKHCEGRC